MTTSKGSRTRALALAGATVGSARFSLYKAAYERIKAAIAQGFFLEAIALEESLIADRLESRISFLVKRDFSFKTLEKLIRQTDAIETDAEFKKIVSAEVEPWKKQRNTALHEMAKLADGDACGWAMRIDDAGAGARMGIMVLRKIDKRYKQLRRAGN